MVVMVLIKECWWFYVGICSNYADYVYGIDNGG